MYPRQMNTHLFRRYRSERTHGGKIYNENERRTRISVLIQKIRKYVEPRGYTIESVYNKGDRLLKCA